jgi:excisionase family DNA binding protein
MPRQESEAMTVRYLRAEELARFAGVAKSTVLAAIRRGEIPSSRTVGRGTRIPYETARAYLESRGCPIPSELREASATAIAVITESDDVVARVRTASNAAWTVKGSREAYATLLWIGTHAPRVIVVDLGMSLLHQFEALRALRAQPLLAASRLVATGSTDELLAAALACGAHVAVRANDIDGLSRALAQEVGQEMRGVSA